MPVAFLNSEVKDILKCYVAGLKEDKNARSGVISFAVPEYGLMFRCGLGGTITDLNVIAFLTFLRFAEHNKEIFVKRELHIFSDFPLLVYLMNDNLPNEQGLNSVKKQARKYARAFVFKVKWISRRDNRAAGPVYDIPIMPTGSDIKIKSFLELDSDKKTSSPKDFFRSP